MNDLGPLLGPPADLEVWLMLGYATIVMVGARLTEVVARLHFGRGRRYAEHGFHFDADQDHFECPQGERLILHQIHVERQIAVYRAPALRCGSCPLKTACAPHDESRHIFRPLAAWTETDAGQFHQWLSRLMFASAATVSLVSFVWWSGRPGSGLFLLALLACLTAVARDVWSIRASSSRSENSGANPQTGREEAIDFASSSSIADFPPTAMPDNNPTDRAFDGGWGRG